MNQVHLLVLSLFFLFPLAVFPRFPSPLPLPSPLSLSLSLSLARPTLFFLRAAGRPADLLSQLELVISLRHVSVCTRVRVRR